jgi:hypothetical protein
MRPSSPTRPVRASPPISPVRASPPTSPIRPSSPVSAGRALALTARDSAAMKFHRLLNDHS